MGAHTLGAESLALGNLAHEVRLLLFKISRETFGLGLLNSLLDCFLLHGTVGFGLLLDGTGESSVILLQGSAEIGVGLSLVVEVDGVS